MADKKSLDRSECYTSHEVSRLCGVAPITVGRWIRAGKLKAFRTVGGHRRILKADLEAFMEEFRIPVDEGSPKGKRSARRILVVDDDEVMIRVLTDMIGTFEGDWEVRGAENGFEAGRMVEGFRPQLVFLDLMMPGIDGFEVCRRIKSDSKTEGSEVVGLTGFFTPENRKSLMDSGALEVYRKPIDLETLTAIVEKVFAPVD
ncbi:MAG: response regulator [Planctomycetota bacterium]|jgi:excisionase family DNA binding protein